MTSPLTTTPQRTATGATILRTSGLRKFYRMGESTLEVLKGVDLSVAAGEFLAIEGRSGSGKSTLLHVMGALDGADSGRVEYDGTDISALGPGARSKLRNEHFGFVFQFYHLLPELNVLENAMLGQMIRCSWLGYYRHRRTLRERALQVLESLGMSHRLRHRPNQLSGGERQRVAIARALMNEPRVLFADEPTGNLDAETGRQIMDLLERLHREQNQTIIMVTHDRSLAREADRVLVLQDGKLERAEK
jgi:lipoprotein-releasing system ATP-binding protein